MNVQTRRSIAVIVVVAFIAISVPLVWLISHSYAPNSLLLRTEEAIDARTGQDITLAGGRTSLSNTYSIDRGAIEAPGGAQVAEASGILITGLPALGGQWNPKEISVSAVGVAADPSDPAIGWRGAANLADFADRVSLNTLVQPARDETGMEEYFPSRPHVTLPDDITVSVAYRGGEWSFTAPMSAFIENRTLDLEAPAANLRGEWKCAVSRDGMTLSAAVDSEPFAAAVAQAAGAPILSKSANSTDSHLDAEWGKGGETVTFTSDRGWDISADDLKSAGLAPPPIGEVRLISFTSKNGRLESPEWVLAKPPAK